MKNLLLILSLFLLSCNKTNVNTKETDFVYSTMGTTLEIYTIDSCQYVGHLDGGESDILTHKGNCNNPIHKYNE